MHVLVVLLATAISPGKTTNAQYIPYPFPPALHQWSVVKNTSSGAAGVGLVPGSAPGALAWGSLSGSVVETGAYVLDVHSDPSVTGKEQAFAAGYLEGSLTSELIWQHFHNVWTIDEFQTKLPNTPKKEAEWVARNLAWMRENTQAESKSPNDETNAYWQQIGFLLDQLEGMTAGFNAHLPKGAASLTIEQLMLITLIDGDMDDIAQAIGTKSRRHRRKFHHTHCSAMVQLSPDGQELWTSHTNWDDYRAMLRIVKYLDLPLPGVAARRLSFDSYPGALSSMTDFYRTSAGLTVTETTLDMDNDQLWKRVTPKTVLTWARGMVANRLARNGDEWTATQLKYQSGTCNNQWIVVDYKLFSPGQPAPPGTLWISETMPGESARADMTGVLNGPAQSWFSYNIPYFGQILKVGGYIPADDPEDSWANCTRARIYAREAVDPTIKDLKSFVAFMRYNNRTDLLQNGDACAGISARCDLNPVSSDTFDCFGAIDIKVASSALTGLSFHATMAPSWNNIDNPPFQWSTQGRGCKDYKHQHVGQPDMFNFSMYTYPESVPSGTPLETLPLIF